MVKLVVAYRHPTDVDEFERRYKDEHEAMARRIPHMSRIEFGKVAGMMDGSKAPTTGSLSCSSRTKRRWVRVHRAKKAKPRLATRLT